MTASDQNRPLHPFDALATIGCIYLGLITFGFAAFGFFGARFVTLLPAGASHNQDRAFFTSANVVSLTGFTQGNASVENYPTLGLVVLGSLSFASALTALIGGGYLLARVLRISLRMRTIVLWSLAILGLPSLVLWPLTGAFDAVSAATGLGLSTNHGLTSSLAALVVACSVLGLLGVVPLRALLMPRGSAGDRGDGAALAGCVAAIGILGAVILLICGAAPLAIGTQSLGLRGYGGAGLRPDASAAMPWAASFLSVLGGVPGGTAGGLTVLPILVLVRVAIDSLRGRPVSRFAGVAIVWLLGFVLIAFTAAAVLAACAPALPADRVLVLAFAALGNVGLSHEPIGTTGLSLFALGTVMLIGRLLPLLMLAWMACVAEREAAA